MKAIRITQQPPRPSDIALASLSKIVSEAQSAPAHHWIDTQITGLLRYAVEFLKAGQWDDAFNNVEKALAKEEKQNNGRDFAARFSEALIQLRDLVTHEANNTTQKESLKKELATKKESKDEPTTRSGGYVPLAGVQRGTVESPALVNQGADVQRSLGVAASSDPQEVVRSLVREETRADTLQPQHPAPTAPRPQRSGTPRTEDRADDQRRKEQTPDHPYLIAQKKREARSLYWQAIADRDEKEIERQARACRELGLTEVLEETRAQLGRIEEEVLREPRRIAVQAWEGSR